MYVCVCVDVVQRSPGAPKGMVYMEAGGGIV
jgi:hypothetical protein